MHQDEERLEEIVAEKLRGSGRTPWRGAYEAAYLRWTLEKGSPFAKARCEQLIKKLRETKWARANDPSGRLSDREFLERFIEAHAPGFDWREDARLGENDDRIRKQEDERIAQEHAEDARMRMSWATKHYTPDAPDGVLLCVLAWEYRRSPRGHRRIIRGTLPTLRELNVATAIPERTLKKIIKDLRPTKGEIVRLPLRHKFSRRGALPLRYGPRLVIGVLNEFLNRLPEFPIDDAERKRLRKTALLVKRAFAARLNPSLRST
jgi:hypothetical protein